MPSISTYLATFLLTIVLTKVLAVIAPSIGLVDQPGGRKLHEVPVPLVGGIGMFTAYLLVIFFLGAWHAYSGLLAGMFLLAVMGILDDLRGLSAKSRLFFQILAGFTLTVTGGMEISNLGDLLSLGDIKLGDWSAAFTIFCVVGLVNAVNMFDGMDGLAGGYVFVSSLWLAYAAVITGSDNTLFILMLASVVAGFLFFNMRHKYRSRASVFMGDAGSMMLGFALAWFGTELAGGNAPSVPPVVLVWILGLPVLDTLSLMFRRIRKGASPLEADREHLHHIFQRAGFSYNTTVFTLVTISALMGAVGIAGWQSGISVSVMFLGLFIFFVIHFYFVTHAWRAMKIIKKIK